jgi:predicted nucleic-acid-binding Zn-ribbon protein
MRSISIFLLAGICTALLSCSKQSTDTTGTRLVKIITTGNDSLGNFCASCKYYELFSYDASGSLVTIKDSADNWMYTYDGPHPFLGTLSGYGIATVLNIKNDLSGKPQVVVKGYQTGAAFKKMSQDSFVYNSNSEIASHFISIEMSGIRFYALQQTCSYNSDNRLATVDSYSAQTPANPNGKAAGSSSFQYDALGNLSMPGLQYDDKPNPVHAVMPFLYFMGASPELLSKNNLIRKGWNYTYYPNGMIRTISYNGYAQEYFYE